MTSMAEITKGINPAEEITIMKPSNINYETIRQLLYCVITAFVWNKNNIYFMCMSI